eukprot:3831315-Rhodomonas_salina.2
MTHWVYHPISRLIHTHSITTLGHYAVTVPKWPLNFALAIICRQQSTSRLTTCTGQVSLICQSQSAPIFLKVICTVKLQPGCDGGKCGEIVWGWCGEGHWGREGKGVGRVCEACGKRVERVWERYEKNCAGSVGKGRREGVGSVGKGCG